MKKNLPLFLLAFFLTIFNGNAQQLPSQQHNVYLNKQQTFAIQKGDSFIIHMTVPSERKNGIFSRVFKTAGISGIIYAGERLATQRQNLKGISKGAGNGIVPAASAGLAINLFPVVTGKSHKTSLQYQLYNTESILTGYGKTTKSQRNNGMLDFTLKGRASAKGWLVMPPVENAIASVTISGNEYQGAIAGRMVMATMSADDCGGYEWPDPEYYDDPYLGSNVYDILQEIAMNGVANFDDGYTSITFEEDGSISSYNNYSSEEITENPELVPDYIYDNAWAIQAMIEDNNDKISEIMSGWAAVSGSYDPYPRLEFLRNNFPADRYSFVIYGTYNIAVFDQQHKNQDNSPNYIIRPGESLPIPIPTNDEGNSGVGGGSTPDPVITKVSDLDYVSGTTGWITSEDGSYEYEYGYDPITNDWDLEGMYWLGNEIPPGATPWIVKDPSITDHANVNCVVINLLKGELKNVLQNFNTETRDRLYISSVPGLTNNQGNPIEGRTDPNSPVQHDYQLKVNADNANDNDYSRLQLAATIIHEAYHAMLLQRMMALLNTTDISSVTTRPGDPLMAELYDDYHYRVDNNLTPTSGQQVQHDWMANHIDLLATVLKEFVEANYKATAAAVGDDLKAYISFILSVDGSIRDSRFGADAMNKVGGDAARQSYFTKFWSSSATGCSN